MEYSGFHPTPSAKKRHLSHPQHVDGTYTLIEKTVPAGYNKAADSTFTIAASNYESSNLVQTATVVNNSGAELPSTGGIGTTIFYVAGIVLVLGAAAIIIARRKAEQN